MSSEHVIKNVLFVLKSFITNPTNINVTERGQLRNHQIIHKKTYSQKKFVKISEIGC